MSESACLDTVDGSAVADSNSLPAVGAGQPVKTADDSGWKAKLNLAFEHAGEKTILRRHHTGPLMVQRPFYPEGPVCHAYILHPPGGIVGGDKLLVDVCSADKAHGLITTPGAAKYYGSDGRMASQQQLIKVQRGSLEWMPHETIYFSGCRASQVLRIDLTSDSRFIGWDISCFGRPAGNHSFKTGEVSNRFEIIIDNKPQLLERLIVRGAKDLSRRSGLRGATVSATMVAVSQQHTHQDWLELVREALPADNQFSVTQIDHLFVVRYLGHSAEQARVGFIVAWKTLRPFIMQRPVAPPRIWAT